jgi:hypothetical protein
MVWIFGAILAAVGVAFKDRISAAVNQVIPSTENIVCVMREQFQAKYPDSEFVVLIAPLSGDNDSTIRRQLERSIRERTGLSVAETCSPIVKPTVGNPDELDDALAKQATKLLNRKNADLLIWGDYYSDLKEITLSFGYPIQDSPARPQKIRLTSVDEFIDDDLARRVLSDAF